MRTAFMLMVHISLIGMANYLATFLNTCVMLVIGRYQLMLVCGNHY